MSPVDLPTIGAVTLRSARVALVPLVIEHAQGLSEAVRDGELWKLWYTAVPSPDGMVSEIKRRLSLQEAGTMVPFAVVDGLSGRLSGMTSYMNIDRVNQRVEIGSTWYARNVQRSGLNTAAKQLLLEHAFESLCCAAVEFRTHFLNRQSRQAIERLGAKLDGILRSHQRLADGSLRDTCVYSIIAPEWPAVRTHLQWLQDRPR